MIGRGKEKKYLEDYLDSGKSEFIAVYGRRRVGKTFLIRQVIGDKACFSLTDMELHRADSEVSDIVDGKYDWRIEKLENRNGLTR